MSDHEGSELLTVQQAIGMLDAVQVFPRVVCLPLQEAMGLRLAEDLKADRDYPPFEKSLMDGYAVRCADVAGGQADLRVIDEIPAGKWPDTGIGPGECMAIMTGAPLPAGADGVVPVEDVVARVRVGENVRIVRAAAPSRYVAGRATDCAGGSVVLSRGALIGPAHIAVAASIGASHVSCFARPRVAVLATGDELVGVGETPGPSNIRNSNAPMLVALLDRLHCEVVEVAHCRDNPELIRGAIVRGMAHDALFITGGMSMGEYDFVPQILLDLEVDLKITRLRIKPGKPFVFGVGKREPSAYRGREPNQTVGSDVVGDSVALVHNPPFVFGLPGNPVSAYVCVLRLASRLIARLGGSEPTERWLPGRLEKALVTNGPREFYQPVVWRVNADRHSPYAYAATVTPLTWKGSADLFTLASANALLIRAENEPALSEGTSVRVLEMP